MSRKDSCIYLTNNEQFGSFRFKAADKGKRFFSRIKSEVFLSHNGSLYDEKMNPVCEVIFADISEDNSCSADCGAALAKKAAAMGIKKICSGDLSLTDEIISAVEEAGFSFYDGYELKKLKLLAKCCKKYSINCNLGIIAGPEMLTDDILIISEVFNYITLYSEQAKQIKEFREVVYRENGTVLQAASSFNEINLCDAVICYEAELLKNNKAALEQEIYACKRKENMKSDITLYDRTLNIIVPDISFEEACQSGVKSPMGKRTVLESLISGEVPPCSE